MKFLHGNVGSVPVIQIVRLGLPARGSSTVEAFVDGRGESMVVSEMRTGDEALTELKRLQDLLDKMDE